MEIHIDVKKKFIPFMDKLLNLHKDNIISIFIYGSAVGKDFNPKISDINSVFIFKSINFDDLTASNKVVAAGLRKRIATPLFLTKAHIQESTDIFPIEYLDMKENHKVLFGEEIFKDIEIHNEHLRLFCEQQLKGKLIHIREAILETSGKRNGIEAVLKESLNSLFPTLRNCLRFKNITPPVQKELIIRTICIEFNLDENLWLDLYKDRKNDGHINGRPLRNIMEQYLRDIEKLATWINRL